MKLKLINKYKSIKHLACKESLPDFTLITGKNGAGKTQLLKMMNGIKDNNSHQKIGREIHVFSENSDKRINSSVYFDFSTFTYDRWSNDSSCLQNDEREDSDYIENEKKYEKFTDSSLGDQFYSGCRNYLENELKFFRDRFNEIYKSDKKNKVAVDANEYRKTHTPPWKIFEKLIIAYNNNNLLNESAYEALPINLPKDRGAATDKFLISKDGFKLYSRDLSSGEKALMGLCYLIYIQQQNTKLPELLLLDEIDSTLHPSVIASLLRAIREVFVEQYKLRVIMVTHSPTTVALAPKDSIFVLDKTDGKHKISQWNQREAIDLLLEGVNTISLDPENTKQVFVESDIDAKIYTKLYHFYKKKGLVPTEIDLAFISSGSKGNANTGSCSIVKKMVKQLREHGNKRIFGIIDKDNKPESQEDGILTLKRYSIENYIFDPLVLLRTLFTSLDNIDYFTDIFQWKVTQISSPSDVDLLTSENLNQYLQEMTDFLNVKSGSEISIHCAGKKLSYPDAFIGEQGHELAKIFMNKFDFLKQYKKEDKLMISVLNRLCELDAMEYLSDDILEIINLIANG